MITFSVPKDMLLYSHEMGTPSDFSVRGFSGGQGEDSSSMTVRTMAAPPSPPTVADDAGTTDAATEISGNVLDNDDEGLTVVAVDGLGALVGVVVAGSNGGEFVIEADGAWTFDPAGDFAALTGSDTAETSVTYHASDGTSEAMGTLTVTVSAASTPVPTDPLWSSVVLCINPAGDNGSTTITDATGRHALTAYNGAQINTSLGYPAILADGSNDYVAKTATSSDCAFGTGDFCVEGFIRVASLLSGDPLPLVVMRNSGSLIYNNSVGIQSGKIVYSDGASWHGSAVANYIETNAMRHFAVSRASGQLKIFYNGITRYSAPLTVDMTSARPIYFFRWDSVAQYFACLCAGLRITKGHARYTADFTPPLFPFPTS